MSNITDKLRKHLVMFLDFSEKYNSLVKNCVRQLKEQYTYDLLILVTIWLWIFMKYVNSLRAGKFLQHLFSQQSLVDIFLARKQKMQSFNPTPKHNYNHLLLNILFDFVLWHFYQRFHINRLDSTQKSRFFIMIRDRPLDIRLPRPPSHSRCRRHPRLQKTWIKQKQLSMQIVVPTQKKITNK